MTVMTILGRDRTDDSLLWIKFDDTPEVAVSDIALAVARRTFQRDVYEQPTLRGHQVDEEMVTFLIKAMDAPQPLWPPLICRVDGCGTEAVELIDDDPYCHGHAQTTELIEEWRQACKSVDIPFRMEDAIQFIKDATS